MQFMINFWMLMFGKLVYGAAAAIMLTGSALYLSETLPQHRVNTHGFAVNLGVTMGISVVEILGAYVSNDEKSKSWLMVATIPVFGAILNFLLWLLVFRTEPLGFCI